MKEFNENQKKAIEHHTGPMLVLAGPGSGKTTVITHRVKFLIEQCRVKPENILVITYTRAAADEMKNRFEELISYRQGVCFGTFHSVFFGILRNAYHYNTSNIISEKEKYECIKSIIQNNHFCYDSQDDFLKNVLSEVSCVKCEYGNRKRYHSKNMKDEDFAVIYHEYDKYLRNHNKLDFDDMLVFTYELFDERPDILKLWQDKFQYILIDEFQDINRIQYKIMKQLAGSRKNIFIVGDDDQSVYSFRGASPDIMKEFTRDYSEMEMVCLNTNYRCSHDIVTCANRIIRNNKNRFHKKIVSAFEGRNERIHVIPVDSQRQEHEDLTARIIDMGKKGIPFSQIAVLFRTNTEARALASKFAELGIPFKIKEAVPNVFTHFIALNIFDYIHIALGDRKRGRILSVINRPNRYISRDAFMKAEVDFDELREYYKDKQRIQNNINVFENDIKRIANLKPYTAVHYIRHACGYDDYIKEYADYRGVDVSDYMDILEEITDSAREFQSYDEWFEYIKGYGELLKEQIKQRGMIKDAVTLSTMHGAKGLEFSQVFVLNAVEGVTPHKKSLKENDIEEERRMFYVAVTRARYGLYIYTPAMMYGKSANVSRFVTEMIVDREILKEGNKIIHKRYGVGTITSVDDKRLCVLFDKMKTTKTLSIEYTMKNRLISAPK